MFYEESLHYLLWLCTSAIFGKNFIPEMWTKIFLANQIAWFSSQLSLSKNWELLKIFFLCEWSYMDLATLATLAMGLKNWLYPKSELMEWTTFFTCWYKVRKAKSQFNNFWIDMVKNGCNLWGHWTLRSAVSQDELSWFFRCG